MDARDARSMQEALKQIRDHLITVMHPPTKDKSYCTGQRYAKYTEDTVLKGGIKSLDELAALQSDDYDRIAAKCNASVKSKDLRSGVGAALRAASALGLLGARVGNAVEAAKAKREAAPQRSEATKRFCTRFDVDLTGVDEIGAAGEGAGGEAGGEAGQATLPEPECDSEERGDVLVSTVDASVETNAGVPTPHTFVINLARRRDRKAAMQTHMEAAGLPFEFVSAFSGGNLTARQLNKTVVPSALKEMREHADTPTICRVDDTFWPRLTRGAVGCALSHLQAWEHFQGDAELGDFIIVMEDDCTLCTDFGAQVATVLAQLKRFPHWRFCLLGSHELGATLVTRRATLSARDLQQGQLSTGLFAYLLHRRALSLLLGPNGPFPIGEQLDVVLSLLEWGHEARFSVATALVSSPLSQSGDSDVQLLGSVGKRAHAHLPPKMRDRLVHGDAGAPAAKDLTGLPRSASRPLTLPLPPPASMPTLVDLAAINNNFKGMLVRVGLVKNKGNAMFARMQIHSGQQMAYYLVKKHDTNSKRQWTNCAIHLSGRIYGDVFGSAGSGSFRPPAGKDGLPYIGFVVNEITLGEQEVGAHFVAAPPHPTGQYRFAIKAVRYIARGSEVCVCYGPDYARDYPSVWDQA